MIHIALGELRRREDLTRDEIRDVLSGMRDGESRRMIVLEEQHISRMPEAEAEHDQIKQMVLEERMATESMRHERWELDPAFVGGQHRC